MQIINIETYCKVRLIHIIYLSFLVLANFK